jgi:hypothetical protein
VASGADVNAQGGGYGNVLQAAEGGYYGNALYAAASEGNEVVVRLLVASGVDVNARGGIYGGALYAAASKGNEVGTGTSCVSEASSEPGYEEVFSRNFGRNSVLVVVSILSWSQSGGSALALAS